MHDLGGLSVDLEKIIIELGKIETEGNQMIAGIPQMAKLAAPQVYLRGNALIADITALRVRLQNELKGTQDAT
jgi:hypothetical protein